MCVDVVTAPATEQMETVTATDSDKMTPIALNGRGEVAPHTCVEVKALMGLDKMRLAGKVICKRPASTQRKEGKAIIHKGQPSARCG